VNVRYTQSALEEIRAIRAYISERNLSAAEAVIGRVKAAVQRLSEFPLSAIETDMASVRMSPVASYPYLIFYTVEADEVVIVHVRHGARLKPWESRR
jgi:addiction module RelE/StbE family toxin